MYVQNPLEKRKIKREKKSLKKNEGEGFQKKKKTKINVEAMEKLEFLCTVSGNVKWYSYYGKQK